MHTLPPLVDEMDKLNLDLCITYRCNGACPNCVEFCNRDDVTGLDYSDSDMTLEQIEMFCEQVRSARPPIKLISITGGEPLLHPHLWEIVEKLEELRGEGYFEELIVNSNRIIKAPEHLQHYIVCLSEPKDNPQIHHCVFVHPSELEGMHNYGNCKNHRKPTIVLNYQGYSVCCAADAYIRLFALEHLISNEFPLVAPEQMNDVCQHCSFGTEELVPFERDVGCPISPVYAAEGEKNRAGRQITKRYSWRERRNAHESHHGKRNRTRKPA